MPKKAETKPSTQKVQTKDVKGKQKPIRDLKKLPIFERKPINWGLGNLQHKRDLSRFLKWPKYVRLQRQRRVLLHRLKIPPTINQFSKALDKATATQLFKLLNKYRPETPAAKKQRLVKIAEAKAKNETVDIKKPLAVLSGLNEITRAIERKEAKLVILSHDVDPIEIIVWLPALCRKMNVPFCIVKSKSRLGTVVHRKTTAALAFTDVNKEDKNDLAQLAGLCLESYNKNADLKKQWGGGKLGVKATHKRVKREKALAKESATKTKAISQ